MRDRKKKERELEREMQRKTDLYAMAEKINRKRE